MPTSTAAGIVKVERNLGRFTQCQEWGRDYVALLGSERRRQTPMRTDKLFVIE